MSTDDNEIYQKGLIITDNLSYKPILDFDSYTDAIVKIIKASYPNFTIGIFGEWGTGKTSLMNSIRQKLDRDKNNIKTIWFDAWKYENEKDFALIPLLKTITFSIKEDKYNNLRNALKEAAIFTIGSSRDLISSIVSAYVGESVGGLFKKSLEDMTDKLIPKLNQLNEIDKNAIFYNGIENIQYEIDKLRKDNPLLRFVIFIDDLDRCSPQKVLEILESIKVFLSLNGIIYVLGISHDTIVNLINDKYKIDGEKYLRKFIQIPITLTEWNESDINSLIGYLLEKNIIHEDYKSIIEDNKDIIASAIEENPRETKRFLNNLIISYEVFVTIQNIQNNEERKKFLKQLLLVQILNSNWKEIYKSIIISEGLFLKNLQQFIPLNNNKIDELLKTESQSKIDIELREILEKYKSNKKLWHLLNEKNFTILNEIDWKIFRRALKVTSDQSFTKKDVLEQALKLLQNGRIAEVNEQALKLLKNGRITEFNKLRELMEQETTQKFSFYGAYLSYANLSGANLASLTLSDANLSYANLSYANLSGANLERANLSYANLSRANLFGTILAGVIISEADLSDANLEIAIIINMKDYANLKINENTKFVNTIIDDPLFINYIREFTKFVPENIKNRKELKIKLNEIGMSESISESLLKRHLI